MRRASPGGVLNFGIDGLVPPEQDQEERQVNQQQRGHCQQHQGDGDGVQQVALVPAGRSRFLGAEAQGGGAALFGDTLLQPAPDRLRFVAGECCCVGIEVDGRRVEQRRFLADLAHDAAGPLHVVGGDRRLVAQHPVQDVGAIGRAAAMREDAAQAGLTVAGEVGKNILGKTVTVGEQRERRRQRRRGQVVERNFVRRRVLRDQEADEMQPLEPAERHQRIVLIGAAGAAFMVTSRPASACSCPGRMGAVTRTADCGSIGRSLFGRLQVGVFDRLRQPRRRARCA